MPGFPVLIEAIHADWPAYPAGHDVDPALDALCTLPPGTRFAAIDDIDQSLLLVASDHRKPGEADEYDPDNYHAALWHDDLRALRDQGLVVGFREPLTAEELKDVWCEEGMKLPEDLRGRALVRAVTFDWDALLREEADKDEITTSSVSREGLVVSPAGWTRHNERLSACEVHPDLQRRALPLADLGYCDVAVREAAVAVEDSLRRRTGTDLSGRLLLDAYVEHIVRMAGIDGAFQRHVRNELRCLMLCIRQEAGSVVDLDGARCQALLRRSGLVLEMLDKADVGSTRFQDIMLVPRPEEPILSDEEIPF